MKRIDLKKYTKLESVYSVKLGNGLIFNFNQEKQAIQFLCKSSKFLTEKMVELNKLYYDCFLLYRQNWILFKPDSNKRSANIFEAERNIKDLFHQIDNSFEKMVWQSSTENGCYIVFQCFSFIIRSLRECLSSLNIISMRQNLISLKYNVISLQNQLISLDRDIKEYEIKKAVGFFDVERLENVTSVLMSKVI
jgi:hypothetical protein